MNLDLIDSLNRKAEPFYAPVPEASKVYVKTRQNGVTYTLAVQNPRPGWFRLRHAAGMSASICGGLPSASHIYDYLAHFPSWTLRALFQSGEQRWAVMPYSKADAAQRGWDGSIRYCHLVRHRLFPGDTFIASLVGGIFIYEIPKRGFLDPPTEEQMAVIDGYHAEIRRQELEAQRKGSKVSLSPKEQVEVGGGRFISLARGVVKWSLGGKSYSMSVRPDGTIISAGVCLDGTDSWHNLVSIVGVMQEHQRLGRTV